MQVITVRDSSSASAGPEIENARARSAESHEARLRVVVVGSSPCVGRLAAMPRVSDRAPGRAGRGPALISSPARAASGSPRSRACSRSRVSGGYAGDAGDTGRPRRVNSKALPPSALRTSLGGLARLCDRVPAGHPAAPCGHEHVHYRGSATGESGNHPPQLPPSTASRASGSPWPATGADAGRGRGP